MDSPSLVIRNMDPSTEYFVGTCTHINESQEIDACGRRRVAWLRGMYDKGLRVKVATLGGDPAGFLYMIPIEICPWGPFGESLSVIPCLVILERAKGRGVGRALVAAAEEEARGQGRKGIATIAYYHDFWFMPTAFFEKCGFTEAQRRGKEAVLWKVFTPATDAPLAVPRMLERSYHFEPMAGKVVVDLFWNTFCETSDIEAQRVREVAAEFGDSVMLREHCAEDRAILCRYQTDRAIFVNGVEIGWGYEAPKEGIREAILTARQSLLSGNSGMSMGSV